jgi:anaerobic selenocysteine-containing dehydrogenase
MCAGIARALGDDWKWSSFEDVWADIKKEVPTHKDVDLAAFRQEQVLPPREHDQTGFTGESIHSPLAMAGPGGQYPKGYRQGAPFQTGQNWPLSWELRAFEAKQRPGHIPAIVETSPASRSSASNTPSERQTPAEASLGDGSPQGGAGEFTLLTGRQIYDEGNMVRRSVALRALQKKPFVEMNDEDVKALGLSDGAEVILEGNGHSVTAKLVIADIVRGAVFVPYDQVGLNANTLGSSVTVTG